MSADFGLSSLVSSLFSPPLKISETTYQLVKGASGFAWEERGFVEIKGKGQMMTYLLSQESPTSTLAVMSIESSGQITESAQGVV